MPELPYVQSLERGLAVIRAFDAEHRRMTLSEVARRTGLDRAAARRFLLTLTRLGYVHHDGGTFSLRPRVLELGYAYLSTLTLPDVAQPHMERLVTRVNESSSIAVLDDLDPPLGHNCLADLQSELELGVVEALRRVLEDDLRRRRRSKAATHRSGADSEVRCPLSPEPEDDAPLYDGRRVVQVHDRPSRAVDRLERPLDQLRPRLGYDRDRDIRRDQVLVDQCADEVEVHLRRRRKTDLDLLEAQLEQKPEVATLAGRIHRIRERLIAVAQVGRTPHGSPLEHDVGPGPVGQDDRLVRTVLSERIGTASLLQQSGTQRACARTDGSE
jgi:hypothetical protein